MKKLILLILAFSAITISFSQIPNIIPYQGQISNKNGKAYDGNFTFQFEILDKSSTSLWNSGSITLAVHSGTYTAHLGENPQPALPAGLLKNDILNLKISFNDGVNGLEALSPNIQILPVPYALRAAVADSAANSNGQLAWGDSLVLRDASGDVRFVLNPNSGEFKILQNDTIWYELETNSPPVKEENQGGSSEKQDYVEINGTKYKRNTYKSNNYKHERNKSQSKTKGLKDTLDIENIYDENDCLQYSIYKIRTNSTGVIQEVTHMYECPSGKRIGGKIRVLVGPYSNATVKEDINQQTTTEKSLDNGKQINATIDTKTGNKVTLKMDARDSCFVVEADKIVLKTDSGSYIIKINKDGSISRIHMQNGILVSSSESNKKRLTVKNSNEKEYEFLDDAWVNYYKAYSNSPAQLKMLEVYNLRNKEYILDGANTVNRLVDSVLIYKVKSKSVLDSIAVIYNLIADEMSTHGVKTYKYITKDIVHTLDLLPDTACESYKDISSGKTITRKILVDKNTIIMENLENETIKIPNGGDSYYYTIFDDALDSISLHYDFAKKEVSTTGAKSHKMSVGSNDIILENSGGDKAFIGNLNTSSNDFVGFEMNPTNRTITAQSGGTTTLITDSLRVLVQAIMQSLVIEGNVLVKGNMNVTGNVAKGGGSFKIDHPDDPTNKYLYHSFVESPDMMNVYNGNATTDSTGYDTIVLPDYFKSLNRDFRYQLTCIGTFAQAIVIQEIENNQFVIQTDKPNVKVSWQVTGIRKDNFAEENRIQVEVEKEKEEKGTLLYIPKTTNP